MKRSLYFSILTVIILLFSCGKKNSEAPLKTTISDITPADVEGSVGSTVGFSKNAVNSSAEPDLHSQVVKSKKIIKEGNINLKTKDILAAKRYLDQAIKLHQGYYEKEELQNNDYSTVYSLKIRIPAEQFEKLVLTIENGKDEILEKNIRANDVTEEFVDIETRLNNKREYLKRYRDLLLKANSVKDILEIEGSIRGLEEELESTEGRLKYLSDQVAYSTLEVNLTYNKEYTYKPAEKDPFGERIKKALSGGWNGFVDFIITLFYIWPLMLIFSGIFYWFRKWQKKRKSKSLQSPTH
ncbi:MAG: DUF4349 domain-containing protein [Sediminibacterium sp.]|nr:DUF4349 domain-containing protein [Sediminibacterium sp.]